MRVEVLEHGVLRLVAGWWALLVGGALCGEWVKVQVSERMDAVGVPTRTKSRSRERCRCSRSPRGLDSGTMYVRSCSVIAVSFGRGRGVVMELNEVRRGRAGVAASNGRAILFPFDAARAATSEKHFSYRYSGSAFLLPLQHVNLRQTRSNFHSRIYSMIALI